MNSVSSSELTEKIVAKAKSLGAAIAGVADVEALKTSPSHRIFTSIGMDLKGNWRDKKGAVLPGEMNWPADAVSIAVIGVEHRAQEPELDWWDGKGTPGNRILIEINTRLSEWIETSFSVKTYRLPYMIEKGGIFLKDAAVLAGLGCIGKNNLVLTPAHGPRIRFRALLLNRKAETTGPLEFNPCAGCEQPCRRACPIKAFQKTVYSADALGQRVLPGINGSYDRVTCNVKMENDIKAAVMAVPAGEEEHREVRLAIDKFEDGVRVKPKSDQDPYYCVKYCRACELACPVGQLRRSPGTA